MFKLRFVPISSLYPDELGFQIVQEFRNEAINHTVSLLNDKDLLENQTDLENEYEMFIFLIYSKYFVDIIFAHSFAAI